MTLRLTEPINQYVGELRQFGQPWHGLLFNGVLWTVDESEVVLPEEDATDDTAHSGWTHYVAIPGLPVPTTPDDLAAKKGALLPDAIFYGPAKKYSPLATAAGMQLGDDRFLVRDEAGKVFLCRWYFEFVTPNAGVPSTWHWDIRLVLERQFGLLGKEAVLFNEVLLEESIFFWPAPPLTLPYSNADVFRQAPFCHMKPDLTAMVLSFRAIFSYQDAFTDYCPYAKEYVFSGVVQEDGTGLLVTEGLVFASDEAYQHVSTVVNYVGGSVVPIIYPWMMLEADTLVVAEVTDHLRLGAVYSKDGTLSAVSTTYTISSTESNTHPGGVLNRVRHMEATLGRTLTADGVSVSASASYTYTESWIWTGPPGHYYVVHEMDASGGGLDKVGRILRLSNNVWALVGANFSVSSDWSYITEPNYRVVGAVGPDAVGGTSELRPTSDVFWTSHLYGTYSARDRLVCVRWMKPVCFV